MSTSTRLIAALLLAGLALSVAASAWELRLTDNPYDQQLPAISGTKVVWQDDRNGNWDIYLYDTLTGETRRLTNDPKNQMKPQIAGQYVIWEDYRRSDVQEENPDIFLLDLVTGNEMMVNAPDSSVYGGYEMSPAISDEDGVVVVVWYESANGLSECGRIFYRYMDAVSVPVQAYQDSITQTSPWVSGQKVVWTDAELGGVYFRYLLDVNTYVLERLSSEPVTGLRSSGDRIVWSQWDYDQMAWNIRLCELDLTMTNGTKSWLSPHESLQDQPDIDDRFVVWRDDRNGGADDLYLYDLEAQQEWPLVTATGSQRTPSIDGGLVAFTDSRHDSNEIYLVPASDAIPLPGVTTVPGGSSASGDPDGDGRCEDVNGNGRKDFADVVLYFNQMGWIAANEPTFRLDYNANGRIDFADVVWLFNHL